MKKTKKTTKKEQPENPFSLRKHLEDRGITQTDVAKVLGVSQQYVYAIFSGRQKIGARTAQKLCDAYGVPVEDAIRNSVSPILHQALAAAEISANESQTSDIDELMLEHNVSPKAQTILSLHVKINLLLAEKEEMQKELKSLYMQIGKLAAKSKAKTAKKSAKTSAETKEKATIKEPKEKAKNKTATKHKKKTVVKAKKETLKKGRKSPVSQKKTNAKTM
jgi:transcriptional regulator with XRE-family HTH domain